MEWTPPYGGVHSIAYSAPNEPVTLTRCPLHSATSIVVGAATASGTGLDTTSTGRNDGAGSSSTAGRNRGSRRHVNTRFVFTS